MGLTGRYNFPGIQKAARAGINLVLAGTSFGIWLVKSPFAPVIGAVENLLVNFLANRGLIILNVGANIKDGVLDQAGFDQAMEAGLRRVMKGRDKITPAEGKKIDDAVKAAFDKNADLDAVDSAPSDPDRMSDLSRPSV